MSKETFRSAIFYWMPDFVRHEVFNVGIALVSKETKFSGAMFVGRDEFKRLHEAISTPVSEETLDWYMELFRDYISIAEEATERGRTFPLRFDHPFAFTALFGRSNQTTIFQWRDASSGFLIQPTPQEEMEKLFEAYVRHPGKKYP